MILIDTPHGPIEYAETVATQSDLWQLLFQELRRYQIDTKQEIFPAIRLCLVKELYFVESKWPALPHYYYERDKDDKVRVDLYLDCSDYFQPMIEASRKGILREYYKQLLHHEMFHVIENVVLTPESRQKLESNWMQLPADTKYAFRSGEHYLEQYYNSHGSDENRDNNAIVPRGYASAYATSSAVEDRAETFALCFMMKITPVNDQYLSAKIKLLTDLMAHINIC